MVGYGPPGGRGQFSPEPRDEELERRAFAEEYARGRRRRTARFSLVVFVVAAVVVASAAAYLTGFIIVGHPFSGVWNTDPAATLSAAGTWRTDGPNASSGLLIKRTSSGYVYAFVVGTHSSGWYPTRRHGRVLESEVKMIDKKGQVLGGWRATFEYQPWSGHLVYTDYEGGRRVGPMVLKKVTGSTSIPPQTK